MSGLTKEQLKSALIAHGVGLPSTSAKKDEYVRLYNKYVTPVANSKGDFSSDDDDLPLNDIRAEAVADVSLVINGVNIPELDDDELYSRLKELGGTAGPVVDTTRKVYQRQLFVLMGGHLPDSAVYNGEVDQEEEYSDNDQEVVEVEEPAPTIRRSTRTESNKTTYVTTTTSSASTATSPLTSEISDVRKRVLTASAPGGDEGVVFDSDLHTISPRRSLRTVTSSSSSSTTVRKFLDNGGRGEVRTDDDECDGGMKKPGSSRVGVCLRLTVKLLFLALIMVLALYFYQNTPAEGRFKAVEQMAQRVLEAAAGEEGGAGVAGGEEGGDTAPPPSPQEPPLTQEQEVFD